MNEETDPPQDDQAASEPAPRKRGRRRWLVAMALLAPALALLWLTTTEPGLRALARVAAGLSGGRLAVADPAGTLLGPIRIDSLRYADSSRRIVLRDIYLDWHPAALARGELRVRALRIAEARVATRETGKPEEPAKLPGDLRLPLAVDLDELRIGRLELQRLAAAPEQAAASWLRLDSIAAKLTSDSRHHRLEQARAITPMGAIEASGKLDGVTPFPLQAQSQLEGSREGRPYRVVLAAEGDLSALSLAVDGRSGDIKGKAVIQATPFAPLPLRRVQVDASSIDPSAFRPGAPEADLSIHAELQPRLPSGDPAQPPGEAAQGVPPDQWIVSGPITIENRAPGPINEGRLPLRSLGAEALWEARRLTLSDVRLSLSGSGSARGEAVWENDALRAALRVQELDLRELVTTLKPTRLEGELQADASAQAQELRADLRDPRFSAKFEAKHAEDKIELRTARLESKGARLDFAGTLELAERRQFEARGKLVGFDPSLYADVPKAALNADFSANGVMQPELAASLEFDLHDSRFDGKPLRGRGSVSVTPRRLAQADVALDLAGNTLVANGAFGEPQDRLRFRIDAPRLGALGYGLGGSVTGAGRIGGTIVEPFGEGELAAADLTLPGGHRLDQAQLQMNLRQGADGPFNLRFSASGYRRKDDKAPLVDSATLQAEGTRRSHVLRARAQARGDKLMVDARGGFDEAYAWSGTVDALEAGVPIPLKLLAPAKLIASAARLELGAAELRVRDAKVRLRETVWTPESLVARGELSGLRVGLVLDEFQRTVAGGGSLRLGAEWDVRLAAQANGTVRVFREDGDIVVGGDAPVSLGLSELELRLNAIDNRLALSLSARGERLGRVAGSATAQAQRAPSGGWRLDPNALLAGSVSARVPSVAWLGPLVDQNLQTAGALSAEFSLTGTPAQPRGAGTIRGEDLSLALVDQGLRLAGGTLRVDFTPEQVRLTELSFVSPNRVRPREGRIDVAALTTEPGRLVASGEIGLDTHTGQIRFEAVRLPVIQREDRWLVMSGTGTLEISGDKALLTARLRANAGYWELAEAGVPRLSDDVVIKGREEKAERRFALTLDIQASLGDSFYLRGRGLDSRLVGEIRVRADGKGPLRATGSISTRGGTFDAYGQDLTLERGILNFQGPIDNPGLNVLALRKNLPVEAGVEITGTARNPRVRLVSEPSVPDAEKLSWIVLGRGLDQAGGGETALLMSAASAILGGQSGGEGITQRLARGLGLDEISVSQGDITGYGTRLPATTVAGRVTASANGALGSQIVTLGKRLSASAYLSYEQSLSGAGNVVKLTYSLSRRLSIIARAGTENAIDLLYTFAFN